MAGGPYIELSEVCKKRGLHLCLGVGALSNGARSLKKLKVRSAANELLVSIEIGRSLDKASTSALDALKRAKF